MRTGQEGVILPLNELKAKTVFLLSLSEEDRTTFLGALKFDFEGPRFGHSLIEEWRQSANKLNLFFHLQNTVPDHMDKMFDFLLL